MSPRARPSPRRSTWSARSSATAPTPAVAWGCPSPPDRAWKAADPDPPRRPRAGLNQAFRHDDSVQTIELAAGPFQLRPWRDDDADAVWSAQQDPDIKMWAGGRGVETREDAVALVRRLAGTEDRASWAVVDAATGTLLGSVSLHSIDEAQADAQIGYWTAPEARGRGVAAAAVD